MATKKKRSKKQPQYWFAAKRYGWGWGRALTWQGWLVYLGFLATIVAYACWAMHQRSSGQFTSGDNDFMIGGLFIVLAVSIPVLFVICLMKGEPPRWRWSKKKK